MGWWGDRWRDIKDAASKVWEGAKAVIRGAGALLGLLTNIAKNFVSHISMIWEGIMLYLFNLMPEKRLRLRVLILSDENGPIAPRDRVEAAVVVAQTTLKRELNVKVIGVNGGIVRESAAPAPDYALEVPCSTGPSDVHEQIGPIFSKPGLWFRERMARTPGGTFLGWGTPITIFVVRDVIGKSGCAHLAWFENYGYIDPSALPPRWVSTGDPDEVRPYSDVDYSTLPHEIGHCCDLLFHRNPKTNLMHGSQATRKGTSLTKWQKLVARTCTHVTW